MQLDWDELSLTLGKNKDYIYAVGGYSGEL